jgi:hypothetical protein
MDEIVRAASEALGRALSVPEPLGGSARATVLRCRSSSGTVIVKAYRRDARASFARETVGLTLASRGPAVLAVDRFYPLIVMSDLGVGPSLADVLLGSSADVARRALLAWASEYAFLAARTAADSVTWRRSVTDLSLDPSVAPTPLALDLGECFAELPPLVEGCGASVAGLGIDLDLVAELGSMFPVFTPGDVCPDNNVVTADDGVRLLDFEGAGLVSAFLAGAYVSMPFATCWCVFRLPPDLASQLETSFRAGVAERHPALVDGALWRRGLDAGQVAWTVHATVALLPRALGADFPMHAIRSPVPTARQLLRYRWEGMSGQTSFPALAELGRALLAATAWDVQDLPIYPALR